ncbi:MAG: hypothetical protein V2A70_05880 [Candidatus Omnitrophota bacterium]
MLDKVFLKIRAHAGWMVIAAVMLVSLSLRLPHILVQRLWPDEALYAFIAREFLKDPLSLFSLTAYGDHLPFFPLVLSAGGFFAPGLAGFRFITVLINVAGLGLTYALGRRVGGKAVGLLAAIFLATNVVYYQQADMIHSDGLFTLVYLILAWALLKDSGSRHVAVILAALGVSVCKWYGIFWVMPVLAGYYAFAFQSRLMARWKDLGQIMAWVVIPLMPYLIFKVFYIHGQGGIATFHPLPWWTYFHELPVLVGGKWHLVLWVAGIGWLWRLAPRERVLMYVMAFSGLLLMSCVAEKDNRYLLPMIPFWGIIFAVGVKESVRFVFRGRLFKLALKAVILMASVLMTMAFLTRKDWAHLENSYTGFVEAGHIIEQVENGKGLILAGSPRQVRYAVSGVDADRVRHIPMKREDFLSYLAKAGEQVILEVDAWDWREQPDWIYPMRPAKVGFLENQGFQIQGIVQYPVRGKMKEVVYVYVRPER